MSICAYLSTFFTKTIYVHWFNLVESSKFRTESGLGFKFFYYILHGLSPGSSRFKYSLERSYLITSAFSTCCRFLFPFPFKFTRQSCRGTLATDPALKSWTWIPLLVCLLPTQLSNRSCGWASEGSLRVDVEDTWNNNNEWFQYACWRSNVWLI